MKPKDFVVKYYPYARMNEVRTGVPHLVTLAQAALESGWGKHAPGNNFFGIKDSKSANYGTQIKETTEYKDQKITAKFETYPSAKECFEHHAQLLIKRFPKAFRYKNPIRFIISVQRFHKYKYATDPDYEKWIIKIIKMIQNIIKNSIL